MRRHGRVLKLLSELGVSFELDIPEEAARALATLRGGTSPRRRPFQPCQPSMISWTHFPRRLGAAHPGARVDNRSQPASWPPSQTQGMASKGIDIAYQAGPSSAPPMA